MRSLEQGPGAVGPMTLLIELSLRLWLFDGGEALSREDRACRGTLQEAREALRIVSLGGDGHCEGIDDGGIGTTRDGGDHFDLGLCRRIRRIDDAERCF